MNDFSHSHSIVRLATRCAVAMLALSLMVAAGQKRPRRNTRRPPQPQTTAVNYTQFSHATKKHQGACNTCHHAPTGNWKKVRGYPDVADYPGHDACVSCHRPQFFKGAKPPICSVCHTKVSPRDDARFSFRNPNNQREFVIEFPHDKHQDVIARILNREFSEPVFVRASFRFADEKTKHYNNCEICHAPRSSPPVPVGGHWPDGFAPDASFFKAAPVGHDSCFNCHWRSQQPVNDNCGGCHKLADKPYTAVDAPNRFSLKFRHGREQHIAECTTCHINITKSASVRGLKPDVPITACTECHNKEGLRLDVTKELEAIDKNHDFVCSYCHTSDVGRRDPPASHYLIAGREPKKRS